MTLSASAAINSFNAGTLSSAVLISDSAANISSNLDQLQTLAAAGKISSISLTDSGTPTVSMSLTQLLADGAVVMGITSNYNLSIDGQVLSLGIATASAAVSAYNAGTRSFVVMVADSAANVAQNLDGLQTLATAGETVLVLLTDAGVPKLSITAAQQTADASIINSIIGTYTLSVSNSGGSPPQTAAGAISAFHGGTLTTPISVSDSSTNIGNNLDNLQTIAAGGKLGVITLTDGNFLVPTITMTGAQYAGDSGAIGALSGDYFLALIQTLASQAPGLTTARHIKSISFTDNATNITQYSSSIQTLIAASEVTTINISDSAANVARKLDALQSLVTSGGTLSITLTDSGTPTLSITTAQQTADAGAIHDIVGSYTISTIGSSGTPPQTVAGAITAYNGGTLTSAVNISDSSTNVGGNLDGLQTLAAGNKLGVITLTDGNFGVPTMTLTGSQYSSDSGALGSISGNHSLVVTNASASLAPSLVGDGTVKSVTFSDNVTDITQNISTLDILKAAGKITAINISDSSSNVVKGLDALQSLASGGGHLAITLTDGNFGVPTMTLTGSQYSSDSGALGSISGSHSLVVTNASASQAPSLAADGSIKSVTFSDNVSDITQNLSAVQNLKTAGKVSSITISDSAAKVATGLDALQTLNSAGGTVSITLTDSGTPTLSITAAQATADAPIIRDIHGAFTISLAGAPAQTATGAIAAYQAGTLTSPITISDSAANIANSLTGLQTVATGGKLGSIILTDSGTPTLSLTGSQYTADSGVVGAILGNHSLVVTGASASLASRLAGDGTITSVAFSDNVSNITQNLSAIQNLETAGKVSSITVSDSAAKVVAGLDGLQTLAAAGGTMSITLTDSGTPVLAVSSNRLVQDAKAINDISGSYSLSVPGLSAKAAAFIVQENASGRGANGIATDYPAVAPSGGNSVVGFQSASLTSGYNAIVLDGPRSSYAIQVNSGGVATIRDIGVSDATYGQTVTVSGASYVLFNGAGSTTVSALPVYNSIYFIDSPANAQLAQFFVAATQFKSSIALSGLEYWQNQLASGMSLTAIAQSFLNTSYFQTTYGDPGTTHATHLSYIQTLYKNILGMNLDAGNSGVAYWVSQMDGGMSAASTLISFTNATASTSVINAVSGAAAGSGVGWLIAPSLTGGYADPGVQLQAQTVMSQGASSNFYNLSLIDPASVGGSGLTSGGITLTSGNVNLGATAPGSTIYMASAFKTLVAANSGNSIHDGPGAVSITVAGTGNTLTLGNATTDALNISNAIATYVFGFTPAKGSLLAVSGTVNGSAATLLNGSTTAVQGSSLNFASSPVFVTIGSVGGNSAAEVATAANKAYAVAGSQAEHVVFLGTDSGGNAEIWAFRGASGQKADLNGNHLVDANEISLVATLIGVPATSLTTADLA